MSELEQTLQKILERSLEVAEQTGKFALDQAPEILEQFFAWHLASHIMGFILAIIILIVSMWVIWKDYKDDFVPLGFIFGGIGIFSGLFIACVNIYQIVFILVAPKIYLIEYFVK